ncbi:MAG: 30S ribosomal protein S17 [Parcubacteria group bacterium RIFCSPHIGHO2_01_FULL_47_10b]|nr:MAG: 30S ribosomal protein S17 [Parcubacteria group bacterium RIFCSPHIGHO2_01_FULL_47_10b]
MLKGIVTSHVSDKTISVLVATFKVHPKYKKRYRVTRKYLAHDEKNVFKTGDQVVITEHRPISKRKRWIVANKTT